jgi:hypothetical protein
VPGRRRRDNSIDRLPEGLRDLVRERLASKAPRYTAAQIIREVKEKSEGKYVLSDNALSRYYHKGLEEEMAENRRLILMGIEQRKQIEKLLPAGSEALTAEIIALLDAGILANTTDVTAEGTVGLVIAKSKLMQAQNEQRKLKLQERRLDQDYQRLQHQLEVYRAKLNQDNNLTLPPPDKVYQLVGRQILGVLRTFGELRPLLDKYARNIATRMGTESERFDWSKVIDGK